VLRVLCTAAATVTLPRSHTHPHPPTHPHTHTPRRCHPCYACASSGCTSRSAHDVAAPAGACAAASATRMHMCPRCVREAGGAHAPVCRHSAHRSPGWVSADPHAPTCGAAEHTPAHWRARCECCVCVWWPQPLHTDALRGAAQLRGAVHPCSCAHHGCGAPAAPAWCAVGARHSPASLGHPALPVSQRRTHTADASDPVHMQGLASRAGDSASVLCDARAQSPLRTPLRRGRAQPHQRVPCTSVAAVQSTHQGPACGRGRWSPSTCARVLRLAPALCCKEGAWRACVETAARRRPAAAARTHPRRRERASHVGIRLLARPGGRAVRRRRGGGGGAPGTRPPSPPALPTEL
jgi:hypothetical protein